jgi:hypothetical protein
MVFIPVQGENRELSPLGRERKLSPLDKKKKFKICQSRYWNCQQRADRRQKNLGFKQETQIISKGFDFSRTCSGRKMAMCRNFSQKFVRGRNQEQRKCGTGQRTGIPRKISAEEMNCQQI